MRTSTSSSSKCFLHVVTQEFFRILLQFRTNNARQPSCPSRFDHWNCNSWWRVQNMNFLIMRLTISLTSSPFSTNIFLSSKLPKTFKVFPSLNSGDKFCIQTKSQEKLQVRIFCALYYCIRNTKKNKSWQNERMHCSKYLLFISLCSQFWFDTFPRIC
jgi:hypothetical protein